MPRNLSIRINRTTKVVRWVKRPVEPTMELGLYAKLACGHMFVEPGVSCSTPRTKRPTTIWCGECHRLHAYEVTCDQSHWRGAKQQRRLMF